MTEIPGAEHFPLPLAPFEWYMLEDDRVDYPMTFSFRLGFSGRIRREAFEAALGDARRRHPLLCARINRRSRRNPCWELAAEVSPYLDWGEVLGWDEVAVPLRCPAGEAIDLTSEPGLRLWVRQDTTTATITLQFHHACCDAIGALQFTGDLLAAYAARSAAGDRSPKLLPLDAGRLPVRGDFAQETPTWMSRVRHLGTSVREAYHWVSRHPAPLNLPEPPEAPAAAGDLFSGICMDTLNENELQSLLAAARSRGVTLNDLLLYNMFLTITDWNGRQGGNPCWKWLRVAMPANLRTAEDQAMPAANRVTMSFLTRAARKRLDPEALLVGIQQETAHIKRTRRGLHLLKGLKGVRAVWGRLPKHFTHKRCLATTVLSNMGDVGAQLATRLPNTGDRIVAGDLLLEEFSAIPPLRRQTRAVLMAATYSGRMTLTARCDPHTFTSAQAEEFLSLYMAHLRTRV